MKKNGFTLVELIATIALIALASTVILINMTNINTKTEKEKEEKYKNKVMEAALVAVDSNEETRNSIISGNHSREELFANCRENSGPIYCAILLQNLYESDLISNEEMKLENDYVWIYWQGEGSKLEKKAKVVSVNEVESYNNDFSRSNTFKVTLSSGTQTNVGTPEIYINTKTGIYFDESCTRAVDKIEVPSKTRGTFKGYYSQENGNGDLVIDSSGKILKGKEYFSRGLVLYASWQEFQYSPSDLNVGDVVTYNAGNDTYGKINKWVVIIKGKTPILAATSLSNEYVVSNSVIRNIDKLDELLNNYYSSYNNTYFTSFSVYEEDYETLLNNDNVISKFNIDFDYKFIITSVYEYGCNYNIHILNKDFNNNIGLSGYSYYNRCNQGYDGFFNRFRVLPIVKLKSSTVLKPGDNDNEYRI